MGKIFVILDNKGKEYGRYSESEAGSAKRRAKSLLNKGHDVLIAHYEGGAMIGRYEMTWANGWVYFKGARDITDFQAILPLESVLNF